MEMIGQFNYDGVGCKTYVKFVNSHWLVPIHVGFNLSIISQIKLFCLCSTGRLCLCHEEVACKVPVVVDN